MLLAFCSLPATVSYEGGYLCGGGDSRPGSPVQVLTEAETAWVDEYHREVLAKVGPRLKDEPEALAWLQDNTVPLQAPAAHKAPAPEPMLT